MSAVVCSCDNCLNAAFAAACPISYLNYGRNVRLAKSVRKEGSCDQWELHPAVDLNRTLYKVNPAVGELWPVVELFLKEP